MNIDLADTKYKKPVESKPKKSRDLLTTILVLGFIGVLAWLGFLFYQKMSLEKDNARLQTSIETTTKRIQELTNSDNPAKKIALAKTLNKLTKQRQLWSEVMAKVIKLESPGLAFQDFSVTEEGEISAVLSARSFNAIQKFIAKLNANEEVSQIIIHSIQLDPETAGLKVDLSFNLKI